MKKGENRLNNTGFIWAKTLTYDEWFNTITSDEGEYLLPNNCFPTEGIKDGFLNSIQDIPIEKIKKVLRSFLPKVHQGFREERIIESYDRLLFENRVPKKGIYSSEYFRRTLSEEEFAWEGITWVMDLLPKYPLQAIEVIKSFVIAHSLLSPDAADYGLADAMAIIRARFIDSPQPQDVYFNLKSPRYFEYLANELYLRMGYDTTLTPYVGDGGKDVIAVMQKEEGKETILIECKRHKDDIGPDVIRALGGVVIAERATKGVIISASGFTSGSIQEAPLHRIDLIDHVKLTKLLNIHFGYKWPFYIDSILKISEQKYGN